MKIFYLSCLLMVSALSLFLLYGTDMKGRTRIAPPPPPFQGVITGKKWIPAHSSTDFITISQGDGTSTIIPVTSSYPDEWWIYIGERGRKVSKESFQAVEIGKFWDDSEKR
jgi:hypothetical protein